MTTSPYEDARWAREYIKARYGKDGSINAPLKPGDYALGGKLLKEIGRKSRPERFLKPKEDDE